MAVLDLLFIPTSDGFTLGIKDNSDYTGIVSPTSNLEISIGEADPITVSFTQGELNIYNSLLLGITAQGEELTPLPDGIYTISYSLTGESIEEMQKSILRVDSLQEQFDQAFMLLDISQCDGALKKQEKVELQHIYFLIQGAVAMANNSSPVQANKLYIQATRSLLAFTKKNCGCMGNNYIINFS